MVVDVLDKDDGFVERSTVDVEDVGYMISLDQLGLLFIKDLFEFLSEVGLEYFKKIRVFVRF